MQVGHTSYFVYAVNFIDNVGCNGLFLINIREDFVKVM